jgi:hypothetical protein
MSDMRRKKFAMVPLDDNWGYRAMTVAGRGAGIILYALYMQRSKSLSEVPITAEILRRCGITRHTRVETINRLVKAGMADVRYRGSNRGCPLLTLHVQFFHEHM